MSNHDLDVFINCPFDEEYRPLFEAVHFTISACGYRPRCALETDDGADLRLNKLLQMIRECPRSVHDLSRTQLNEQGLPRFNMPFELGLMMGAKYYGGKKQAGKSAVVLVAEPYRLPAYMSDLGGNDPSTHHGNIRSIIEIVRRYLHVGPDGAILPGAGHLHQALSEFLLELPNMAQETKLRQEETGSFSNYRTYAHFVAAYLRNTAVL